jgi:hypothetical protein
MKIFKMIGEIFRKDTADSIREFYTTVSIRRARLNALSSRCSAVTTELGR